MDRILAAFGLYTLCGNSVFPKPEEGIYLLKMLQWERTAPADKHWGTQRSKLGDKPRKTRKLLGRRKC